MGNIARMGEMGNTHKVLIGKPEWKRPFGSSAHRFEDNIKINLKVIGY
jgi:hypothetical protein